MMKIIIIIKERLRLRESKVEVERVRARSGVFSLNKYIEHGIYFCNFDGRWKGDFRACVAQCSRSGCQREALRTQKGKGRGELCDKNADLRLVFCSYAICHMPYAMLDALGTKQHIHHTHTHTHTHARTHARTKKR